MKIFLKDWWPVLLIMAVVLWRKRGGDLSGQPSNSEQPKEKTSSEAAKPTSETAKTGGQQTSGTVNSGVNEYAGGNVITYNGKTYYSGGPIGKTIYDDMAAERAKYNSCPVHGTSTMRHIHTYNQGHVEDYYQCTVCGHKNIVYTK